MKAILAFVFVGAATAKRSGFGNDKCAQPRVTGPCYAYFQRYYYNQESGTCQEFVYGGCKGNGNNFETQQACERACVEQEEQGAGSGQMDKPSWGKPSWGKPSWGKKPSWPRGDKQRPDRGEGGEAGSGAMEKPSWDKPSRGKLPFQRKWSWPRGEGGEAGSGEMESSESSDDRPPISFAAEEYLKRLRAGGEGDRPPISYAAEEYLKRLRLAMPDGEYLSGFPMGSGEFAGEETIEEIEKWLMNDTFQKVQEWFEDQEVSGKFEKWIEKALAGADGHANGSGALDGEMAQDLWTKMAAGWGARVEAGKARAQAAKDRMEQGLAGGDNAPNDFKNKWYSNRRGDKADYSSEAEAEIDDAAASLQDGEPKNDDLAEPEEKPKNKKALKRNKAQAEQEDADAEADVAAEVEVDQESELRKLGKKAKKAQDSKKAKKAKN